MQKPSPTPAQPLAPHERYYQATKAMHNARGYEQLRNRQADVQEALAVLKQAERYNLS
jgi:hypothetical protein